MYIVDLVKIEEFRKAKGVSKRKLGKMMGYSCSSSTYYFLKHGAIKNRRKVLALCKTLDINNPSEILIHPQELPIEHEKVNRYIEMTIVQKRGDMNE